MMRRAFTAWYDDETGELTTLRPSDWFRGESALMQLDVTQDALGALTQQYDVLYEQVWPQLKAKAN